MPTILFICEHGSAKSVIAAAHCRQLAKSRGIDVHAISRGTSPDSVIAPPAANGLAADGLPEWNESPAQLVVADIVAADRVVTFSPLPRKYVDAAIDSTLQDWSDVPAVSDDYVLARAAIVGRVEALLREMSSTS